MLCIRYTLYLHTCQNRSRLLTLPNSPFFPGKAIFLHTLLLTLDAIPELVGSLVVHMFGERRMVEVLVQLIYMSQDGKLAGNTDVVDGAEVLGVLYSGRSTRPEWGTIGMSNLGHGCISQHVDVEASYAFKVNGERKKKDAYYFAISVTA